MTHHLAQVNVARLLEPLDSARLADFVAGLDPINALAEASPGFIWRLQGDGGDATDLRPFEDDAIIVNLTVWTSIEALADFAFGGEHLTYLRRRREWFSSMATAASALWWVPAGHRPTPGEAQDRLARLDAEGPGPHAFTFRHRHPAP